MPKLSSRDTSRSRSTVKSYERPEPTPVVSHHAGTCLEDGLNAERAEINDEQREAAVAAFKREVEGSCLDLSSMRRALQRLDDALFQRLVESRWDEEQASGGKGVDCDGFLRLYFSIFTPATTFGRHLRKAAGRGDQDLVRELVLRGCNPNTGSGTGETALYVMAAFGQLDCAKALKALCGQELIMQPRDRAGWTPLMIASGNGHTPFVQFLLDESVDPEIASDSGRTAMHLAAARGRDRALRVLMSKKTKVDCKDNCGYTPLHLATIHDEVEAMHVLLEAGTPKPRTCLGTQLGITVAIGCGRMWSRIEILGCASNSSEEFGEHSRHNMYVSKDGYDSDVDIYRVWLVRSSLLRVA
ncbi:unnamed protein product [Ascophyllum nodosum]